jgi:phospholipid/cholesterol/gamma-HCH transport system substrate-binding protein
MSQRSMEMKVGGLLVASLVLLVGFVVLLGGLSLQPTFRVYVNFDNPGGLQSGAPVRISGVRIGRVTAIEFRGGELDKNGKPLPAIRVVADIEARHHDAIYEDAKFYVTTQGMLGEMHLAVDPGDHRKGPMADNTTVEGESPPRLDQLLNESYQLLHTSYRGVQDNRQQLGETFDGLHKTLTVTGRMLAKHEQDISHIVERVDSLTVHVEETLAAAREQYVDGPRINRILARLDHSSKVLDENLEPILVDTRQLLSDGKKIGAVLAEDQQLAAIRTLTQESLAIISVAKSAANDTAAIIAHVKAGKGTAGALIMDDAIFDDLQELMRDLKHNPWKIMWKE